MGGNETLPDGFSEGDIPPFLRPSVWGFSQDSPGAEEFDDSFRHSRWANVDPERHWNEVEKVFQGLKLAHPRAFQVLSNLWSKHIDDNLHNKMEEYELYPFEPDIPPVIRQTFENRIQPSLSDGLEPLVGALFAGPNLSAILISSALSESEKSAFLNHAYGHFLLVHIPQKAFYVRLEYGTEFPPALRADKWYRDTERIADWFADIQMDKKPRTLKLSDVVGDYVFDIKTTFTSVLSRLRHK